MTKHTFVGASYLLRNVLKNLKEELVAHRELYRCSSSTLFSNVEAYRMPTVSCNVAAKHFTRNYSSVSTTFNIFQTISQTTQYQPRILSETSLKWTGSIARMHDNIQVKEPIDTNLQDGNLDVANCDSKSSNGSSTCNVGDTSDASSNLLSQSGGEADSFGFTLEDIIEESKQDTEVLATSVVHAPQTSIASVLHTIEKEQLKEKTMLSNTKETKLSKDVKSVLPAATKPNTLSMNQPERSKPQNSEQLKRVKEISELTISLPEVLPIPPKFELPKPRIYAQPEFFSPANKILPLKKIQEMANDLNNKTAMTFGTNKSKIDDPKAMAQQIPDKKRNSDLKRPFIYSAVEVPQTIKNIVNIEENPVIMERKKRLELIRNTVKNVNKNSEATPPSMGTFGNNKKTLLFFKNLKKRTTDSKPSPPKVPTISKKVAATPPYNPVSGKYSKLPSNSDSVEPSMPFQPIMFSSTNSSEEPKVKTNVETRFQASEESNVNQKDTKYDVTSNPFKSDVANYNFISNKYALGRKNVQPSDNSFRMKKYASHLTNFPGKVAKDNKITGGSLVPVHINKQYMSTYCKYMMLSSAFKNQMTLRNWNSLTRMDRQLQSVWAQKSRSVSNESDISDAAEVKSESQSVPPDLASVVSDEEKDELANCPQSIIDAHEEYHRLMKKEIELTLPTEDIGEIPPGVYQRSADSCADGFRSIYAATAPFCSLKSDEPSEEEAKKTEDVTPLEHVSSTDVTESDDASRN